MAAPRTLDGKQVQWRPAAGAIDALIEVAEPLGMETLVFFRINGLDVCGRVSPNTGAREGARMRLCASLENMHLIDDATGGVI
jgi:multiple sugar transport system ATP-binding protein